MSEALKTWAKHADRTRERHEPVLSREERRSLQLIRQEARAAGSELKSNGKGGLSPSLVLGVMRRDEYTCKVCGQKGNKAENGGIEVHHKGGIVESKWLSEKGHKNVKNNLVTICVACHDRIHNKAREEGVDSSQVEPEGDKE
jgi:5-methylcytosine-specific restriction endonuclease McrA